MSATLPPALLALSAGDTAPGSTHLLLDRARRAVEAGLRGVLLREPALEDGPYLEQARTLAELLAPVEGWLGLHDRPHLAATLVRPGLGIGVHLGFRSLTPREARRVTGPEVAIGFSGHADDEEGAWSGADYLFHGPVFDTPSKRGLIEPVGSAGLAEAVGARGLPVWALGGVTPESVPELLAAGASGVAVLRPILAAHDSAAGASGYLEALDRARPAG